MTFCFDARAVLAEIRKTGRPRPTVPTPPTPAPPAAQTVGTIGGVGGLDLSNRAFPDFDRFTERAAIIEYEGVISRAAAEGLAAEAQGFDTPAALYQAAVRGWLNQLDALERREGRRRQIDNARAFTAEGWAAQALALGWDELALFGLCPRAPWQRLDRMGAAWLGSARAVTADAITYSTGNRLLRAQQALGAALVLGGFE